MVSAAAFAPPSSHRRNAAYSFSSGDVPGDGDDDEANALAAVCVEPFEVSRGGTPSSATARVAASVADDATHDVGSFFFVAASYASSSSSSYAYASRSFGVSPFPPKHSASSVATAACTASDRAIAEGARAEV